MTPIALAERTFFDGMSAAHLEALEAAATEVSFSAGTTIFREGSAASVWYLVTEGVVTLEIDVPGRGPHVLGWSWLFAPYLWSFDAYARTDVEAVCFDGEQLRIAKQKDPSLGYELMQRFAQVLVQRMQAARLQLLDIYGNSR